MSTVSPVPEGWHTITPNMIIRNAAEALDFYQKAFGAQELGRHLMPDGKLVMHATLKIGDSLLLVADEFPEGQGCPGWISPQTGNGTTVNLHLYVENIDTAFKQAIDAGCTPIMEPTDAFWGDRYGQLLDPYGHHWSMATHIANLTQEEVAKAAEEMFGGSASS